jgi:single-stranded DNA-binding protein
MSIIYSKEQDGTLNVLVCGKVVRDPEVKQGNNGSGSRVKFSVCYGKKKYMDCEAWADSDIGAVADCLEKGDVIGVMGTHRTWEYQERQYSTLTADMIFTLSELEGYEPTASSTAPKSESDSAFSEIDDSDGELPF